MAEASSQPSANTGQMTDREKADVIGAGAKIGGEIITAIAQAKANADARREALLRSDLSNENDKQIAAMRIEAQRAISEMQNATSRKHLLQNAYMMAAEANETAMQMQRQAAAGRIANILSLFTRTRSG